MNKDKKIIYNLQHSKIISPNNFFFAVTHSQFATNEGRYVSYVYNYLHVCQIIVD
jgi:hypothetical protein